MLVSFFETAKTASQRLTSQQAKILCGIQLGGGKKRGCKGKEERHSLFFFFRNGTDKKINK